ncbi:MAG: OmpA family protein [Acidobacteriota bacterium]|nr:OmpA family protein [Acidobacteriota bacterium]
MTFSKALLHLLIIMVASVAFVFAQVDVPRKTNAVTYPLDHEVMVSFRGTTRYPRMKGEAVIERTNKNGTEISLSVSKMPRPFELGAGYATYVLWAISPNGQVDNLGEIKRRGFWEFDSKIKVTTPLQTFALIVTAEPHFLVSRPSQEIMLENLNPYSRSGRTIATTTTIQYFGNSSDYFRDARTPQIADVDYRRTPTAILQATQAVALARFAGAERDALDELQQAEVLLRNAESAWKAGRDEEYVDIAARKAISEAVKAETTASIRRNAREKRNEALRRDAELRAAENKFDDAQSNISDLRAQLAAETRAKELAERDAENYANQLRDLKAEYDALRRETQDAKIRLAAFEARQKALEEERDKDRRLNELKANSSILVRSLGRFGKVDENERGIVMTLEENYWSGLRVSSFNEANASKLDELGRLLAQTADYDIKIESHTDDRGEADELEILTKERAQAIEDKLMSLGVPASRMESKGYGATVPVASNATRANRAKNRRVQIILVPNIN